MIFYPGDEISIKVDDNKFIMTGTIYSILDNSINFNGQYIELNRIAEVDNFKKRNFHRFFSKQALYAIPPIIVFDAGNRLVNTKERPVISKEALKISAVFATVSLALMPYKIKRYRMHRGWKIKMVDVTP